MKKTLQLFLCIGMILISKYAFGDITVACGFGSWCVCPGPTYQVAIQNGYYQLHSNYVKYISCRNLPQKDQKEQ